ncbi:MAG TPA: tetratricopeptide repeat protein [Thermoanaerobaculia bacterium]|nr:tetratricopeptide repeat protein [Thermoanaerobaculia bacterium]
MTYANLGRIDEAIAEYEKALEMGEGTAEAASSHNNLGAIYLDRGELEKAAERFQRAIALAPGHLESRYNLALIYPEQGRLEDAVEMLEAAALLQPNHELVNLRLGLAYVDLGRGEKAYRSLLLVRRLLSGKLGGAVVSGGAACGVGAGGGEEVVGEALEKGGEAAREMAEGLGVLEGVR